MYGHEMDVYILVQYMRYLSFPLINVNFRINLSIIFYAILIALIVPVTLTEPPPTIIPAPR
jgi:hypothetical protein